MRKRIGLARVLDRTGRQAPAAPEEGQLLSIARWCEEIPAFDALPPAASF